jgi:hypothetical protein
MRHNDSSRRPRVDPAENPRLAAALGRLSNGIRDAIAEAPSSQPAAMGEPIRSSPDDEVYVPDNDEIELLDDGPETVQRAGPSDFANEGEEMVPTSGELELMDRRGAEALPPSLERVPTPSFRQGVIAYGAPIPPDPPPSSGDEVLEPSDSELELFDAAPEPAGFEGAPAGFEGAPADFEGTADPDATPLFTPDALDAPDAQPGEHSADAPVESPGGSPWATAAAEKAIDARALPSSLAPMTPAAEADKPKPAADPAAGSPGKSGRSWLTIFLAIALLASVVTFLLLKFNVVDGPEGRPSADTTPIQVPTSGPAATQAPAVPAPPEPVAAPEPSAPEPAAAPSPTGEAPAAASAPTVTPTATPGAPGGLGTGAAPTGVKPSGPSQSGKKPSRIF